ncbi:nuclear transport factor 2 family protein [Hyalangium rubrum]|uniref:Nuclear transport factor 2 family protein n=1 Tax=Hyalangium rubrum TaxID=3103134 RepID=A0ABU5HD55_9BACT|nr:nuclear transport factor 2 family protein [Hyalangium sp. s54d21]MDY7230819.1 nuclear transport factor 2 family protein [Hyalangium sp. s54d21]
MSNLETVQSIYAAFSRGDVRSILEHLSEDVEWEYGVAPNDVPWLQARHGRSGALEFLQSLQALEFHTFEPKTFLEAPRLVVVLVDIDLEVKATGQRIAEKEEVHIWRFDETGQVVRFRHAVDSYQHSRALRAGTASESTGSTGDFALPWGPTLA